MDDLEIYLRIQTYQNKITRPILKFIAKSKWLSTTRNIDIYRDYHIKYKGL